MCRSRESERLWGVMRLILGLLQIVTSSMALVFVMNLGTHPVSLACAGVACALTLTSLLLFRGQRRHGSKDAH